LRFEFRSAIMRAMTARLQPLTPPYEAEIDESLRRLMGSVDAEPLALFRTIAHHPALLERFRQTGSTLLSFGRLPAVDRETIIHRTTARCGAAYEWGVHAVVFAQALGLDDEWLRATWHGAPEDFADPGQALLVRFADELHDGGAVSEATWAELRERYDDAELVELVCLAGFYHLVSYLCRAFAIAPEAWAAAVPEPA
jgi:4-carboxymuconolactone decarboxylase